MPNDKFNFLNLDKDHAPDFGEFKKHYKYIVSVLDQALPNRQSGLAEYRFPVTIWPEKNALDPFIQDISYDFKKVAGYGANNFYKKALGFDGSNFNEGSVYTISKEDILRQQKTIQITYDEELIVDYLTEQKNKNKKKGDITKYQYYKESLNYFKNNQAHVYFSKLHDERDRVCRENQNRLDQNPFVTREELIPLPDLSSYYYVISSYSAYTMWGKDLLGETVALKDEVLKVARMAFRLTCHSKDPYNAVDHFGYVNLNGDYSLFSNGYYTCRNATLTPLFEKHLEKVLLHEISTTLSNQSAVVTMLGAGYFCHDNLRKQYTELYAKLYLKILVEKIKENISNNEKNNTNENQLETIFLAAPRKKNGRDYAELEYLAWDKAIQEFKEQSVNKDILDKIQLVDNTQSSISTYLAMKNPDVKKSKTIAADGRMERGHGLEECAFDGSSDEEAAARGNDIIQIHSLNKANLMRPETYVRAQEAIDLKYPLKLSSFEEYLNIHNHIGSIAINLLDGFISSQNIASINLVDKNTLKLRFEDSCYAEHLQRALLNEGIKSAFEKGEGNDAMIVIHKKFYISKFLEVICNIPEHRAKELFNSIKLLKHSSVFNYQPKAYYAQIEENKEDLSARLDLRF